MLYVSTSCTLKFLSKNVDVVYMCWLMFYKLMGGKSVEPYSVFFVI